MIKDLQKSVQTFSQITPHPQLSLEFNGLQRASDVIVSDKILAQLHPNTHTHTRTAGLSITFCGRFGVF